MYMFVVALHVLLCLFLILIILLQPGKGGDVGAAFGGGSSSAVFGPRGPGNLLQRATTVVAVLFMCTSVTLALYSNRSNLSNANVEGALQQLQQEEAGSQEQGAPGAGATPAGEAVPGEAGGE